MKPVTDAARIKRRIVQISNRKVHLLTAGAGSPLLLVHGSPNSSHALKPLISYLAQAFLVIAPDTPGNGESTPLTEGDSLGDYAEALLELLDALALPQVGAYGYHSGAAFVAELGRCHPHRLSAIVCDGLPMWNAREVHDLEDGFLQSYAPTYDGAHLMRLWTRLIDQNWYFPWHLGAKGREVKFDLNDSARLHERAMELLVAGDAHMAPYKAALKAGCAERIRALEVPTLALTHRDDVIAPHLRRVPSAPAITKSRFQSRKHLRLKVRDWFGKHAAPVEAPTIRQAQDRFVDVPGGQVFVRGAGDPDSLWLHDAGESSRAAPATRMSFDLPAHGLTDIECPSNPHDLPNVLRHIFDALHADPEAPGVLGAGLGYQLANVLSGKQAQLRASACLSPEIAPRWDGGHLMAAWHFCRFRSQYRRWDERMPQGRLHRPLPSPEELNLRMIDLLRAGEKTVRQLLPFSVADTA